MWRRTDIRLLLVRIMCPCCHGLPHELFEGKAEGTIAQVAAIVSQLLDGEWTLGIDSIAIEMGEIFDAQPVDIGIVCSVLT